jgi:chromosome segregation ATPase
MWAYLESLNWKKNMLPLARVMTHYELLERQLAAEREQVAILRSDENRLSEFAKAYRLRADEAEDQLAAVAAAIHKIHPTRRGSLVDMVEDLESHRETAINAFRLSEAELAAERAIADRLGNAIKRLEAWIGDSSPLGQALAAWKEARRA